jgi:hypothetical protein
MDVVVDIECTGRTHKSVFAVAFCCNDEAKVFYLKESCRSPDTISWWESDPYRKKFLEESLSKGVDRHTAAVDIRKYIDDLYTSEWFVQSSRSMTYYQFISRTIILHHPPL